eukprot:g68549.t1
MKCVYTHTHPSCNFVLKVLGLRYNEMVDMWSVGCVLYEMYTGKILFNGEDNNAMLKEFQQISGCFPKKTIRKGAFWQEHFDEDMCFKEVQVDSLTKQEIIKKVRYTMKPEKDIVAQLLAASKGTKLSDSEKKKVLQPCTTLLSGKIESTQGFLCLCIRMLHTYVGGCLIRPHNQVALWDLRRFVEWTQNLTAILALNSFKSVSGCLQKQHMKLPLGLLRSTLCAL